MGDFSGNDMDFAMGSLFGLRSWRADEKGRLTGITFQQRWTPGVNTAECYAQMVVPCTAPMVPSVPEVEPGPKDRRPKGTEQPKPKRRGGKIRAEFHELNAAAARTMVTTCEDPTHYDGYHVTATDHHFAPNCNCGFWAYNEGNFAAGGDVTGVIEAWGKTTIGPLGFRAEKAKIVGLITYASFALKRRLDDLYGVPWMSVAEALERFPALATENEYPEVDDDFWDPVEMVPRNFQSQWGFPASLTYALPTTNPGGFVK